MMALQQNCVATAGLHSDPAASWNFPVTLASRPTRAFGQVSLNRPVILLGGGPTAATTSNTSNDTAGYDFREFLEKDGVGRAVQALRNRRNDESHVRGVDALDLPSATEQARTELKTLIAAADFIVDLPLILAESDELDELSDEGKVMYRQLSGDHAVVPVQSMRSDRRVERHSLYLLDAERRLHLLRPFMIAMQCPICRNPSTFHIDRLTSAGPEVKSLEDGHTTTRPDLRDALARAGLINQG